MLLVLSVVLSFTALAVCETENEPMCLSRYDYDYKMLTKLVDMESRLKQLAESTEYMEQDRAKLRQEMEEQLLKIDHLSKRIEEQDAADSKRTHAKTEDKTSSPGTSKAMNTYVRWGKTTCPSNGTQLVYSGYVGGSHYTHTGAAVDFLCLPRDPLWGKFSDTQQWSSLLYAAEYELDGRDLVRYFGRNIKEDNVPCAVCATERPSVLMIPGRNLCYDGWTVEYHGYLTTGYYSHNAASQYVCLDRDPESLPNTGYDHNGKLFFFVEARCGSLPCPPYVDGREITCAVCSN